MANRKKNQQTEERPPTAAPSYQAEMHKDGGPPECILESTIIDGCNSESSLEMISPSLINRSPASIQSLFKDPTENNLVPSPPASPHILPNLPFVEFSPAEITLEGKSDRSSDSIHRNRVEDAIQKLGRLIPADTLNQNGQSQPHASTRTSTEARDTRESSMVVILESAIEHIRVLHEKVVRSEANSKAATTEEFSQEASVSDVQLLPPLHQFYEADTWVPLDQQQAHTNTLACSDKMTSVKDRGYPKISLVGQKTTYTVQRTDLKECPWFHIGPGTVLRIGNFVELIDNTFLLIERIEQYGKPSVHKLCGQPFRRIEVLRGWLPIPRSENEVVMFCEAPVGEASLGQYSVGAWLHEVRRLRCLTLTGACLPTPTHFKKPHSPEWAAEPEDKDISELICRWKYVASLKRPSKGRPSNIRSFDANGNKTLQPKALLRLTDEEAEAWSLRLNKSEILKLAKRLRQEDEDGSGTPPRKSRRGPSSKQRMAAHTHNQGSLKLSAVTTVWKARMTGASNALARRLSSIPKDKQAPGKAGFPEFRTEIRESRLRFADAFCGAGGMSRAAKMANFDVCWGVDQNEAAIKAYGMNFPEAGAYQDDVAMFASKFDSSEAEKDIDILHISPPCQPWSGQMFRAGQDNKLNKECLKYITGLVKKVNPRVVTLEETYNLLKDYPGVFASVVESFTSIGYSIRWNHMNMVEYGLPQKRKRVIIVASR